MIIKLDSYTIHFKRASSSDGPQEAVMVWNFAADEAASAIPTRRLEHTAVASFPYWLERREGGGEAEGQASQDLGVPRDGWPSKLQPNLSLGA